MPLGRRCRRSVRPRSLRAYAAGLALLCVFGLVGAPWASADTVDDKTAADRQVAELESALEDTSAELAKAYTALAETQALMPAARSKLMVAEKAAREAARHNEHVGEQLAIAEANVARAEETLTRNLATRESTQRTLDAFAADMFQGGASGGQLSVALGATSADDFATRLVLADTVTSLTNQALNDLAAAKADGDANQAYLDAVRSEVTALKHEAEIALAAAETTKAQAATAKQSLDALVAKQSGYAADVESRKADEQARLNEAEAEQARLQALLVEQARIAREEEAKRKAAEEAARKAAEEAAKKSGQPPPAPVLPPNRPSTGSSYLAMPVQGARVSSEFGMRFHPILRYTKLHTGMDLAVSCGTPVYAAADGRIFRSGWRGAYGNSILVDHGIQRGVDLVTTYNHLSSIVESSGHVKRGQLIGYSGTTGWSTGCHLHFETLNDGTFVNPRTWL